MMPEDLPGSNTKSVTADSSPQHFTREPFWIIPLAGLIVGLLPLVKYGQFQRRIQGIGLLEAMLTAACLGAAAAAVLVVRSHIRSIVWSNVVLWGGILIVTIGVCVLSVMMPS